MKNRSPYLLALLALQCVSCASGPGRQPPGTAAHPSSKQPTASRSTRSTGQLPILPDSSLTPGAVLPVTADDICVPGYSSRVRDVPIEVKRQAYAEYGIPSHTTGDFEVDHLISLELGGSNSLKNLWPESFKTEPWNAHVKDQLENRLHELVCSGQLDLKTAQHDIATNWIAAYKRYFRTDRPLSQQEIRSTASHRQGGSSNYRRSAMDEGGSGVQTAGAVGNKVWVNLNSGKYWRPGTQYYGKTKRGQYMLERQAVQQGYTAARNQ